MSLSLPHDAGVLLVGHGTRDARGRAEFAEVGRMLQARLPGVPVQGCFLELAAPDIDVAVAALASRGSRELIVVTVLLFAAGHAKDDIPTAVTAAAARHGVTVRCWAQPLDCHEQIIRLSARRFREALTNSRPILPKSASADAPIPAESAYSLATSANSPYGCDCFLILVGRGTSDAEAIARVHEFAARRIQATAVAGHIVCFLAAASPTLDEAIETAKSGGAGHVVVQPHLLFHGRLADEVQSRVRQLAAGRPAGDPLWHFAGHLGAAPELVDALVHRIEEAV